MCGNLILPNGYRPCLFLYEIEFAKFIIRHQTLLSGDVVEWARIEFKEAWDAAASLKTICAFANDLDNWGGGYIVIGVKEDNGRPVYPLKGVAADKLDKYQKEIFAKCKLI